MDFLNITKKDIKIILRDRTAWIMLLIVPIIVISLSGFALSGLYGGGKEANVKLPVIDYDKNEISKEIIEGLKENKNITVEEGLSEQEVLEAIKEGEKSACLIFPEKFTENIKENKETELKIVYDPNTGSASWESSLVINSVKGLGEEIIKRIAVVQISSIVVFEEIGELASIVEEATKGRVKPDLNKIQKNVQKRASELINESKVKFKIEEGKEKKKTEEEKSNPFNHDVPGYALMFMLFGIMNGAVMFLEEKESGTFRRLLITPIRKWSLLFGKLFAQFIVGVVQMIVLFIFGYFVFKLTLGSSLFGLFLLICAAVFAAVSLGALLSAFVKTRVQATSISILCILAMSALGGSWWPLWITPDWMQNLAHITITAWGMEGFQDLMLYGKNLIDILPKIGALLIYGLICFGIAIRFFKFKE